MDWKYFWQEYPVRKPDLDQFQQVGKTKYQKAINEQQFKIIIEDIINKLELNEDDILLDLCCGNGLITRKLGKKVQRVIAIDFSKPLIDYAKAYNKLNNITYIEYDVNNIEDITERIPDITKVLCYEALSFFNDLQFYHLLQTLSTITPKNSIYFFASVLDNAKKFNFFNTLSRKLIYMKLKMTGRDFGLGKWWKMKKIKKICEDYTLCPSFYEQNSTLHTAHYRSDVLIKKKVND